MKQLLYLKDEQLKEFIEQLFVGYRETFSDCKKILNNWYWSSPPEGFTSYFPL